ncbi:hypothetical protein MMC20_005024 [Loxospora ochrophaea]|nr:hypothetical protein [Loxospora ochrophaea]
MHRRHNREDRRPSDYETVVLVGTIRVDSEALGSVDAGGDSHVPGPPCIFVTDLALVASAVRNIDELSPGIPAIQYPRGSAEGFIAMGADECTPLWAPVNFSESSFF